MEIEGDYADVLAYMANLFSIKKIETVSVDRYTISYRQAEVVVDPGAGTSRTVEGFPEKEDVDRIKSIDLDVGGIEDQMIMIRIGWNSVIADHVSDRKKLQNFLDILDKSTFRYF